MREDCCGYEVPPVCFFLNPTLKHILNGCSVALKQGRYTWRHDKILTRLVKELQTFLQGVSAKNVTRVDLKGTFITFVRGGKQPCGRRTALRSVYTIVLKIH